MFVTTSSKPTHRQVCEANNIANHLQIPFVTRNKNSLEKLFQKTKEDEVLLLTKRRLEYHNTEGRIFFFHPNLAVLRIKQIIQGQSDSLLSVGKISQGDHVLDCTLGMGADSIVASHIVGEKGSVISLESEVVIATLVKHGLNNYQSGDAVIDTAMRRVQVVHESYEAYLQKMKAKSFDVILFDPMFRHTVRSSSAIQGLKPLANESPVDPHAIKEAMRVARKQLVLKERAHSKQFKRLGFQIVKKNSRFAFGVIDVRNHDV